MKPTLHFVSPKSRTHMLINPNLKYQEVKSKKKEVNLTLRIRRKSKIKCNYRKVGCAAIIPLARISSLKKKLSIFIISC